MTTRPLAAVGRARWETCVTLAADLFVAVVFRGQNFKRGLDESAAESALNMNREL